MSLLLSISSYLSASMSPSAPLRLGRLDRSRRRGSLGAWALHGASIPTPRQPAPSQMQSTQFRITRYRTNRDGSVRPVSGLKQARCSPQRPKRRRPDAAPQRPWGVARGSPIGWTAAQANGHATACCWRQPSDVPSLALCHPAVFVRVLYEAASLLSHSSVGLHDSVLILRLLSGRY